MCVYLQHDDLYNVRDILRKHRVKKQGKIWGNERDREKERERESEREREGERELIQRVNKYVDVIYYEEMSESHHSHCVRYVLYMDPGINDFDYFTWLHESSLNIIFGRSLMIV